MNFAKDIPGYEGRYAVDMVGNVFSYFSKKVLKPNYYNSHVSICLGHPNVRRWVHDLVLTTFVCPRPEGAVSRHLDGNAKNNNVFNLEWSTHSQNLLDIKHHGFMPSSVHKLSVPQIQEIKGHLASEVPMTVIADWFNVSDTLIQEIRDGGVHRDV